MCEITVDNFCKLYPNVEADIKNAKFVAIDTEFSALNPDERSKPSLFDSPQDRYRKLRQTVEQIIPLQIGLTTFSFDADKYKYVAKVYNFYIFPRPFANIDHTFTGQASSLQFLYNHKYDFSKFPKGVSFKNNAQESKIRQYLSKDSLILDHTLRNEFEHILEGTDLTHWYHNAKEDDVKILPNVYSKYQYNYEILYHLHSHIRSNYKGISTYIENNEFYLKKGSTNDGGVINHNHEDLKEDLLKNVLGFSKIFKLLQEYKPPLIGHNFLTDLMILLHCCSEDLPKSYTRFKKTLHTMFPIIYDTKTCSFNIKSIIDKDKLWMHNTLQSLFEYFKDGFGRHVVLNSPYIEIDKSLGVSEEVEFHNAGYDSYCTGYIFIRMANICANLKDPEVNQKRKILSSELLHSMGDAKNAINLIQCSISNIQLDGNDPISKRPPFLIVESLKNSPVNIAQVRALLSDHGFIDVLPFASKGHSAIVAVDNFGSHRRILQQFRTNTDYKVRQYSILQHRIGKRMMWSGALICTAIGVWIFANRSNILR